MPRPEFPKTLRAFQQKFSLEQACWEYLWQSRWPEGFHCSYCSCQQTWWMAKRHLYECKQCGHQFYPTAGTIMHRTHFPIQDWFWSAYWVATHTPGMSAKHLQRQMGCTYKTAWFVLHRLRQSMINDARTPLHGRIEADETIVGGPVKGIRGRGVTACATNTVVFGAVEVATFINTRGVSCEKAGRLRLSMTDQADEKSIKNFLVTHVEKGSTVCTDGWRGYSKTALKDDCHQTNPDIARHIHRAFGNLKTWLNGRYHGVSPK